MDAIISKHAKYTTSNPISKFLVKNFFKSISELYNKVEVDSVFDGGCGEGFVLNLFNSIKPINECYAIDINDKEVKDAQKNLPFCQVKQASIYEIPFEDKRFDLVISSEVLEHVDNPIKGIVELNRVCKQYAILSVPREPIWRVLNMARFKYWNALGNTPDHVNHWSRKKFISFVSEYFEIIEVRNPLPWTIILCKRKSYGH